MAFEEREILFDETNCTLTTEIGEQIDAEAKQEGYATEDVTKNPRSTVGVLESQVSPGSVEAPLAAASSTKYAYLKTYYEDAVKIDLNSVTAKVKWTYNGSCVTASSNHTASYGWFTTTHWTKDYSTVTSGRSCSEAYTRAVAHFSNWPGFVNCSTTYVTHQPTKIAGQENGSYTRVWTVRKYGGCTSYLYFRVSYGLL